MATHHKITVSANSIPNIPRTQQRQQQQQHSEQHSEHAHRRHHNNSFINTQEPTPMSLCAISAHRPQTVLLRSLHYYFALSHSLHLHSTGPLQDPMRMKMNDTWFQMVSGFASPVAALAAGRFREMNPQRCDDGDLTGSMGPDKNLCSYKHCVLSYRSPCFWIWLECSWLSFSIPCQLRLLPSSGGRSGRWMCFHKKKWTGSLSRVDPAVTLVWRIKQWVDLLPQDKCI
ncbi:hypothetical protein JOB18_007703 [Solea senegalensis]|uniref:Uncharacterized protein n=1 Tax=Solea senegalensis TaxID=28829 RepID=A0AAV6SA28_SOLSE|nr:hypothetical protein JOB18_007703 [Solea senegalensis]